MPLKQLNKFINEYTKLSVGALWEHLEQLKKEHDNESDESKLVELASRINTIKSLLGY